MRQYADQGIVTKRYYAELVRMDRFNCLEYVQKIIRNYTDRDMMITHHRSNWKQKQVI